VSEEIKNVFVSHHHKDDASVDGFTRILGKEGTRIRNSSIRAKPENQKRLDKKQVPERVLKRLLQMKMRWAGKVIVVIGKETHTRTWVNWEIEVAKRLGKPIIGVYENGLKDKVEIPKALEKHANSIVAWRPKSILNAMNGNYEFQNPDGSVRAPVHGGNMSC